MAAYYNENDPFAAQWLRNLIAAGHIAPGHVDERDIRDVRASDLDGFTQCHFFAGIGVWSYALRKAGWPDDRPVWTGSCPCQPFSGAGKRKGVEDERHLWPVWFDLIRECRPGVILGEQVASRDGLGWWDIVSSDLEREAYPGAALDLCVPGIGGPHIRQRLYWMAHATSAGYERRRSDQTGNRGDTTRQQPERLCDVDRMAHADDARSPSREHPELSGARRRDEGRAAQQCGGASGGMGHTKDHDGRLSDGPDWREMPQPVRTGETGRPGPVNGFWADADWLFCTDGKWRPAQSSIQQMVDGNSGRVGPLRADLDAAVKEAAKGHEGKAEAVLRALQQRTGSEGVCGWRGRILSVHEAQILLSCLLERQGKERNESHIENGSGSRNSAERNMRVLQRHKETCNPPRERGLERQSAAEFANTLRALSSAVARFASASGYPMCYADAPASFPLSRNTYEDHLGVIRPARTGRVGRLRAYGNAICAPLAQEFIEAVMDVLTEGKRTMNAIVHKRFDSPAAVAAYAHVLAAAADAIPVGSGGLPILKLVQEGNDAGYFVYGEEAKDVSDDDLWAINPFHVLRGYICFSQKNEVLGEVLRPITAEPVDFDKLPVHYGKDKRGKEIELEWQAQIVLHMQCIAGPNEGASVVFKPISGGGLKLCRTILHEIARKLAKGTDKPVPTGYLSADSYKAKTYGNKTVWNPLFEFDKWVDMEFADADAAPAEDEDEKQTGREERKPAARGRSRDAEDAETVDDAPRGRRDRDNNPKDYDGRSRDDDDAEEAPKRGRGRPRKEETADDAPRSRGRARRDDEVDDQDEEGNPRRTRKPDAEDSDRKRSEPAPRRGRGRDEDDDAPRGRERGGRGRDRDDDDAPRGRSRR